MTHHTNNSTVVAACAAFAVTAATAALQQRSKVTRAVVIPAIEQDEDEEINSNAQPIWRENRINDSIVIETQGSTESMDSMDSPMGAAPLFEEDVIKPTSSSFHVKEICMVAAWVACVATAQWNRAAVPPTNGMMMTPRHITDDIVHQCIGETTSNEKHSSSNEMVIETPIFILHDSPPPTCWIDETRVEPSHGMYGPTIGADSMNDLSRLHHTSISELQGVYGSLVVDAPYELQFKSVALEEFMKKHDSKVELPEKGVYGAFLAPNEAELQVTSNAVQAWLDHTVTIDVPAVYGGYVNWEGLTFPSGILESFAELQTNWSLHQQAMIHL